MGAGAPRGDYKLVLTGIDPEKLPAIVAELAEVLSLDPKIASDLAGNLPIVLIGGMSQQQAATLRTHLVRLIKLGAQMSLSAEPVGRAKQLQWAAPAPMLRRPAHVFMCPSCGERFIVQRLRPPELARPVVAAESEPAEALPAEAEALAAESAGPEAQVAEAAEAADFEAESAEAVAAEAEPMGEGAGAEGIEAAAEALPAEGDVGLAEPEAPAEEAMPLDAEPVEAEPLEAEAVPIEESPPVLQPVSARPQPAPARPQPVPPRPQPMAPKPQPGAARPQPLAQQPRPLPAAARPGQPKPAPGPAPKPAPAPAPQGPRYDVSVAKVRGAKQEKLAELIAARQGVSYDEALKMCERLVVMVCKDAPEAEASEWRKALVSAGIEPRIRKH